MDATDKKLIKLKKKISDTKARMTRVRASSNQRDILGKLANGKAAKQSLQGLMDKLRSLHLANRGSGQIDMSESLQSTELFGSPNSISTETLVSVAALPPSLEYESPFFQPLIGKRVRHDIDSVCALFVLLQPLFI